jgi:oligoendopeptidase F
MRPSTAFVCAVLLQFFATGAQAQATPNTDATTNAPALSRSDPRFIWDLTRLYPTDAAWDAERKAVLAEVPSLASLKGKLGTAAGMRTALDRMSAMSQRLQRLFVYANTQQSTDNRDARNQERTGLMRALGGQYRSAVAWVNPEVQSLGAKKVEGFIRAEPGLKNHAVRLRDTLRLAKHTLGAEAEGALAAFSPVIGARQTLYGRPLPWTANLPK